MTGLSRYTSTISLNSYRIDRKCREHKGNIVPSILVESSTLSLGVDRYGEQGTDLI